MRTKSSSGKVQDLQTTLAFKYLAKHARQHAATGARIQAALPPHMRDHVRFADAREGVLTLLVSTPAWAGRLRMLQQDVLLAASKAELSVNRVRIRIAPPVQARETSAPLAPPLSRASAQHLQRAAQSIRHPALSELFVALAATADKSD